MKPLYFAPLLLSLFSCSKKDDAKSTCCSGPGPQIVSTHPNLDFFIPYVITPNGDGRNDFFFPIARDKSSASPNAPVTFTTQKLQLYHRVGATAAFGSTSSQRRFDGHDDSGAELPEGSYRFELQLDDNSITGNLCIVRTTRDCSCMPLDLQDQLLENCK